MAFMLQVPLENVEYRGLRTGVGQKSGRPWMSLVVEDGDANQIEISVSQDMQGDVYGCGFRKGDILNLLIRAVARNDGNSYIQLMALPELVEQGD